MCSAKVAKRSPDMHQRYGNLHKDVTIHQISRLHQVNYLYIQSLDTQMREKSENIQRAVENMYLHPFPTATSMQESLWTQ